MIHFITFTSYISLKNKEVSLVKDDRRHNYHPERKMICEKYLEIFKDDKTMAK